MYRLCLVLFCRLPGACSLFRALFSIAARRARRRAAALPTSRSASNLHLVYFYPLSTSLEEICGSTLAASSQDGATLRPTLLRRQPCMEERMQRSIGCCG